MIRKIGIFAVLSVVALPALAGQSMQWGDACLKDAKMYCANMMKTDQQTWDCMAMNMNNLSSECQKEMMMKNDMKAKNEMMRKDMKSEKNMMKEDMKAKEKMMQDKANW